MASEQTGVKKKQLKSIPREERSRPILYRHQDCIPSAKLLQNCEQINSVGLKSSPSQECCKRLDNRAEVIEIKNNKRKSTPKVKKDETTESNPQNVDVKHVNGTDGGQDEVLSRSRKRRLRKQKLLESLVSSSTNHVEPSPPSQSNTQIKSIPVPHTNNQASAVTSSSTTRPAGELAKISPKDPRKRPDKSNSRSKSIKIKPLFDESNQSNQQLNQTKASIFKALEEKNLNTLLQTLAPFVHTSPKKEKPAPIKSAFSFPESRLLPSESKTDKDGVFYFGETKHQLQKLTAELNKSSESPSLVKEKSDIAQVEVAKSSYIDSSLNTLPNSVLNNNFSFPALDQVKTSTNLQTTPRNTQTTDLLNFPNKSEIENITAASRVKAEKLSLSKDQIVIPKSLEFIPSKELEFLITAVKSLEKPVNSSDNIPETTVGSQVSSPVSTLHKDNLEEKNSVTKMKLEDQPKSNKTREEILKEREAKKAAKLAAKAKHKGGKSNEEEVKEGNYTSKLDSSVSIKTNSEAITKDYASSKTKLDDSASSEAIEMKNQNEDVQLITEKINAIGIESTNEAAPSKSKSELRAERRAKQEAQRAVKAAEKEPNQPKQVKENKIVPVKPSSEAAQSSKKPDAPKSAAQPKPKLFGHLYQEKTPLTSNEILKGGSLHPAVVQLGVQYSTRVVVGSNARCVALLCALKQVVNDYITPLEKEFSRGVEEELGLVTRYLHHCRPLAVSMTNALRHIKRSLTQLPNNISDKEARSKIRDIIDQYIHEQIDVAGKAICNTVKEKIMDGDVVLTYGCSSLVYQILVESHMKGTKFRVVVVDGRPWLEGREMLRKLVNKGLSCTYVLITAASFIMREATKVLLGAHALLANGCVMSRAGSSQVALLAHCNNVPVLVCCETHKFSERVQTDAFVYNEIGELCCDGLKERERLTALSLAYDITPPDLVSAVVTELAVLPCTSVPVILRIKPSESVI